jgi:hypothetical protein
MDEVQNPSASDNNAVPQKNVSNVMPLDRRVAITFNLLQAVSIGSEWAL